MMFLTRRFYQIAALNVCLFLAGYMRASFFLMGQLMLILFLLAVAWELLMLYRTKGISASRHCSARFSNGDNNPVKLRVESRYSFRVKVDVIDEVPAVFQKRDVKFELSLLPREGKTIEYTLRPVVRGEYGFGKIRVFTSAFLGLVCRRFTCGIPEVVKVYPSYLMLRQYELMAISNNLTEFGIKKIRRAGNCTEFEQIKDYVEGDDYRTINWKASARRHALMVNVYQDERSQQIYNVIDKGRMMQQSFNGMTLLDYAINASLVLSYIAMRKDDKAGLATFNDRFDSFVPASRQQGQMQRLLEGLYAQQTTFEEADYSSLCVHLGKLLHKRSLLVVYTNFYNIGGMQRQLPYLIQLSRQHRVLVVFFEDEELNDFIECTPRNTECVYQQAIGEKYALEKRLIVSMLKQHGIYSLLTTPDNLSVGVINKYLEMKNRQLF